MTEQEPAHGNLGWRLPKTMGWEHVAVSAIVCMGILIRISNVTYSLDGDEIFSLELAQKSLPAVISASLRDQPHPPLYNFILYLWIQVWGPSEASVRILSVVFSVAFLITAYALFRRVIISPLWLILGVVALLSISPFFVFYGSQARPYSLITYLSTANMLAFFRWVENPRATGRLVVWLTTSVLLLYAQYLGILIIFAQAIAGFYLRTDRWKPIANFLVAMAAVLPWAFMAMHESIRNLDTLSQINWMGKPSWVDFIWFYVQIVGDPEIVKSRWILGLAFVIALMYNYARVAAKNIPLTHVLLFAIGFAIPASVFLISLFGPKPIFAPRQLIGSAVAAIGCLGLCIAATPKWFGGTAILSFLTSTAISLPLGLRVNTSPPWRETADKLSLMYASRAVVTPEDWIYRPLAHYGLSSVQLWADLDESQRRGAFLFVCRPQLCSEVDNGQLKYRFSSTTVWQWGKVNLPNHRLLLYEIESAD